jgi:signal transduction histidine kinase
MLPAVSFLIALVYLGIVLYVVFRRQLHGAVALWLTGYAGWSVALSAALAIDNAGFRILDSNFGIWLAVISLCGLAVLGALTMSYLKLRWSLAWLAAAPVLALLTLVVNFADPGRGLIQASWRDALIALNPSAVIVSAAWAAIGAALLVITYREYANTRLPLHANRILWWLIVLPLALLGEAAAQWGDSALASAGEIIRAIGVLGIAYGVLASDILDIRGAFRGGLGNAVFILVSAIIILAGVTGAIFLLDRFPGAPGQISVGVLIIVLALFHHAARSGLGQFVTQAVFRAGYNTAQTAADYSKRIAQILELDALVRAAGEVLAQSIEVTHTALILISPLGNNRLRADVYSGQGETPTDTYQFESNSPFILSMIETHKPVLQYNVDVAPQYKALATAERKWLQKQDMDVFVPIMDGGTLNGILAVGPRKTGDPYRAPELELLTAIADQTSVALKNARLVTKLRQTNDEMQVLNDSLAANNEQLKELDKAKADFITVASHELRTPLTQISGFSELLQIMSETEAVPGKEVGDVADNIVKACRRLNEVVGQMLQVSEIDVEVMQLRIGEASMEAVLRGALQPYTNAIRERKITFGAHGVRNLPAIQGDAKRLTEAFSQVISNAIKYTPDGGRVDIRARFVPRDEQWPDTIQVTIADSGIGISPQYLDLIFQKFFRIGDTGLHSTGNTKFMGAGPGLGLPIARGIIEAHGGRIWAESPGYDRDACPGTQIHIILPLRPSPFSGKNAPSLIGENLDAGITPS